MYIFDYELEAFCFAYKHGISRALLHEATVVDSPRVDLSLYKINKSSHRGWNIVTEDITHLGGPTLDISEIEDLIKPDGHLGDNYLKAIARLISKRGGVTSELPISGRCAR